jgi:N-terminal domain of anti-restriction factor ArdC
MTALETVLATFGNVAAVNTVAESPKVQAENAKRTASGRAKMTAEEAREFEMYSQKNAAIVEDGCENGCVAYEDIFTFKRWIAQGFVVRKGEKATRIEVPNFREIVDEKTGEKKRIRIGVRMVPVFCRCQVKRLS